MSRHILTLWNESDRKRARQYIEQAPAGTRVEFRAGKRSIDQNSRLWLLLSAVSVQLIWHGQKYTPNEWKDYFCHALRGEKWMPFEEGGMIPIGRSTSKMDKHEFGELMELIEAFCARWEVILPWVEETAA